MPSFRTKVLDALDIKKSATKLNVRETFPCSIDEITGQRLTGRELEDLRPYAVSETLLETVIGPSSGVLLAEAVGPETVTETDENGNVTVIDNPNYVPPVYTSKAFNTLDVLGFVVGEMPEESTYKQCLPMCFNRESLEIPAKNTTVSCFHYLNGLYDPQQDKLKEMRKSAVKRYEDQTLFGNVTEHSHADWPHMTLDQNELFRENPYADSLFYGSMKLSMLLTGIALPLQDSASNHRGLVRMLILRPRLPSVKMRLTGAAGTPLLNMSYPHHFDTDLFYSAKKTLGGRMNNSVEIRATGMDSQLTEVSPTFGLTRYRDPEMVMNIDSNDIHYGHYIPGDGLPHDLTPFDIITSPINHKAYKVLRDETFHLDTQHHGAAAQKVINTVVPFNMKVKFAGRKSKPASGVPGTAEYVAADPSRLGYDTFDEPMNINSRPFIMFLSMDQKISAQVTGYTNVYET
jgi:hypothetical protein